nr:hypothetical protein [Tanacetum cinerariifolium]
FETHSAFEELDKLEEGIREVGFDLQPSEDGNRCFLGYNWLRLVTHTLGCCLDKRSRCPLELERKKQKLNCRVRYVWDPHRRGDLVEVADVSVRVFFIVPEKLLVLDKINQTMLNLKIRAALSGITIASSYPTVGA